MCLLLNSFNHRTRRIKRAGIPSRGWDRGEQRRRYDERKRMLIPEHGLRLVVIEKSEFVLRSRKIDRDHARDLQVVRQHLT